MIKVKKHSADHTVTRNLKPGTKPANISLRGSLGLRGCFAKQRLTQRVHSDWDSETASPHSKFEFQYQIPKSFEARGWNVGTWRLVRTRCELEGTSSSNQRSWLDRRLHRSQKSGRGT